MPNLSIWLFHGSQASAADANLSINYALSQYRTPALWYRATADSACCWVSAAVLDVSFWCYWAWCGGCLTHRWDCLLKHLRLDYPTIRTGTLLFSRECHAALRRGLSNDWGRATEKQRPHQLSMMAFSPRKYLDFPRPLSSSVTSGMTAWSRNVEREPSHCCCQSVSSKQTESTASCSTVTATNSTKAARSGSFCSLAICAADESQSPY